MATIGESLSTNWGQVQEYPDFLYTQAEVTQMHARLSSLSDNSFNVLKIVEREGHLTLETEGAESAEELSLEGSEKNVHRVTLMVMKLILCLKESGALGDLQFDSVQNIETDVVRQFAELDLPEAQERLHSYYLEHRESFPEPQYGWVNNRAPKHPIEYKSFGRTTPSLVDLSIHHAPAERKSELAKDFVQRGNGFQIDAEQQAAVLSKGIKEGFWDSTKALVWNGRKGMDSATLKEVALECSDKGVIEALLVHCTADKQAKSTRTGNLTGNNQKYEHRLVFATQLMDEWTARHEIAIDEVVVQQVQEAVDDFVAAQTDDEGSESDDQLPVEEKPMSNVQKLRAWAEAKKSDPLDVHYGRAAILGKPVVLKNDDD